MSADLVIKSIVPINKLEIQLKQGDKMIVGEFRYNCQSYISNIIEMHSSVVDNLHIIFEGCTPNRHTTIDLPIIPNRGYNIVVLADDISPEGNFDLLVTLK